MFILSAFAIENEMGLNLALANIFLGLFFDSLTELETFYWLIYSGIRITANASKRGDGTLPRVQQSITFDQISDQFTASNLLQMNEDVM